MNFTALVILLEIDNILAGVFQKKIDKLEVNFDYNEDTIAHEFNRAADFVQKRSEMMYWQRIIEVLFIIFFNILLFMAITFIPIFLMMIYVVAPIPDDTK